MAKNSSGKDRIKLYSKSLISLVYDLLARHTLQLRTIGFAGPLAVHFDKAQKFIAVQ